MGVTKGTGLKFLAERIGVGMDQTMACGDSENDMFMLKAAHIAVAMENATAQVKNIADYITASNENSGVSRAVEEFVLKRTSDETAGSK